MLNKGEHNLIYNLKTWVKQGNFYILNYISENVTLVQLMDTLGNVNHDISILGYWIFDYNHEKLLHLTRESLDITCSPSIGKEQVVKSETVFNTVRYLHSPGNLKIG